MLWESGQLRALERLGISRRLSLHVYDYDLGEASNPPHLIPHGLGCNSLGQETKQRLG